MTGETILTFIGQAGEKLDFAAVSGIIRVSTESKERIVQPVRSNAHKGVSIRKGASYG